MSLESFNITNFREHPNEEQWLVFRFPTAGQALEFEAELRAAGLRHERDEHGGPPYLVAARKADREKAVRLNYLVLGRHREPFIANKALRWALILLLGLLLGLIVIGAILGGRA
ncbi:MAG TPA: hypothetical protein PKY96_01355 [Flavobacteriales bacterium]|nr:hypothetical protein [Flavobacteriales bacterium]